jgi:hypothetical protein
MLNDSPILARLAGFDGMVLPASPGADVVADLFENVIRADVPVVIIGGVDKDIAALRARYGLTDIRWHQPHNPRRKNPEAISAAAAFIAANPARFHFLCVGGPQQKMLAAAALGRGDAGVWRCAAGRARSSSRAGWHGRRAGCGRRGWNGCSGWPRSPGGSPGATWSKGRPSSGSGRLCATQTLEGYRFLPWRGPNGGRAGV